MTCWAIGLKAARASAEVRVPLAEVATAVACRQGEEEPSGEEAPLGAAAASPRPRAVASTSASRTASVPLTRFVASRLGIRRAWISRTAAARAIAPWAARAAEQAAPFPQGERAAAEQPAAPAVSLVVTVVPSTGESAAVFPRSWSVYAKLIRTAVRTLGIRSASTNRPKSVGLIAAWERVAQTPEVCPILAERLGQVDPLVAP